MVGIFIKNMESYGPVEIVGNLFKYSIKKG
jgi:hypothetical protein